MKLANQKILTVGEKIVLLKVTNKNDIVYSVWDKYRLDYIYFIIIAFFSLILIFAGMKGLGFMVVASDKNPSMTPTQRRAIESCLLFLCDVTPR